MPKTLALLLCVALAVRILFFLFVRPWDPVVARDVVLQVDAGEYHDLATTLEHHHRFARTAEAAPNAYRTPGYPAFIAAVYSIGGDRPWVVLLAQIVLDAMTSMMIFLMISATMDYRSGLVGAAAYALDPFLVQSSVSLLSDTLFVFLCVLGALFFSKAIARRFAWDSRGQLVLAAAVWGLATLVRPTTQFFVLLIPVLILWIGRKSIRHAAKSAGAFAIVFVLVIAPWVARNLVMFGQPALSTSGAYNMLILYAVPLEVERQGAASDTIAGALLREADDLMRQDGHAPELLNDFQKSPYWQHIAVQYVAREPGRFAKLCVVGVLHSFGNLGTRGFAQMLGFRQHEGDPLDMNMYSNPLQLLKEFVARKTRGELSIGIVVGLFLCLSYALCVVGIVAAWGRYDRLFLVFCLFVAMYFMVISGPYGLARYRLPAIPFYAAFVGAGAVVIASKCFRKSQQQADTGGTGQL